MTLAKRPEKYRFAIVGGGSAGCLLARRLVEADVGSVLLIEAGDTAPSVLSAVPNFYPRLFGSRRDWAHQTQPQAGLNGRRIAWPRGKLLGGSGAINALIYLQAAQADLARWGWAAEQLDKVIVKPPVELAPVPSPHPWTIAFLEAAQAAGLRRQEHWTTATVDSCGLFQLTQAGGRRRHTGQWIYENQERLQLTSSAAVTRILFSGMQAVGLEYVDTSGGVHKLDAEEVILCSGTLGSPELLMRSGIGDAQALQQCGITCHYHLPWVGANLQDHLVFPLIFRARSPDGLARRHGAAARLAFRQSGSGGLASNIAEAGGLVSGDRHDLPEFQTHFTPTHYLKYPHARNLDGSHLTLAVTDLHPHSRGRLRLVGSGVDLRLSIEPEYLSDGRDIARILTGLKWHLALAQQPALRKLIGERVLPGPRRDGDPWLEKAVRMFAQTIYHPVGTCRMDSPQAHGESAAVVDPEFRVHGCRGLRVVDASVLPDLPSCNTNAVTCLLAEMAAYMILKEA